MPPCRGRAEMARHPIKAERTVANRRAHHHAKLAAAPTALARLAAAVDWLRAVIANAPGERADRLAEEATTYLIRLAEQGDRP